MSRPTRTAKLPAQAPQQAVNESQQHDDSEDLTEEDEPRQLVPPKPVKSKPTKSTAANLSSIQATFGELRIRPLSEKPKTVNNEGMKIGTALLKAGEASIFMTKSRKFYYVKEDGKKVYVTQRVNSGRLDIYGDK